MSKYFDQKDSFLGPKVSQYGSHMVMTDVQKESKRKYINIDTRFCNEFVNQNIANIKEFDANTTGGLVYQNATYTNASYTITLPQRITDVRSIMICNLEMPISFYNISAAIGNNAFSIKKVGAGNPSYNIFIPDGNYTISTLSTTIATILNSNSYYSAGTFTCTPTSNGYFHIENTTADSFTLEFDINSAGIDKYLYKSTLGWLLGFHNSNGMYNSTSKYTIPPKVVAVNGFLNAEYPPNMNGPRYFFLVIDEFSNGFQNSFWAPITNHIINKNIIARIAFNPAVYTYGSVLPANNFNGYLLSDRRSYNGKVDIQKLRIELIDEFGQPVSLNGNDFSFCMEVEYE